MGSTVEKYYEMQEDIKKGRRTKIIVDEVQSTSVVSEFESEYPELSKEFKNIQSEMYEMFAAKHMDYGLNNIALGGDILNN